jgi:hypothetical protein
MIGIKSILRVLPAQGPLGEFWLMPWVPQAAWRQIKMQETARMPQEQQALASRACLGELKNLGA